MKSRAFYRKDQFYIKVKMTDDVWSDMDDEMLNKVDEFEKHLSDKAWEMFTSFLNLPVSSLKAEIPYVKPNNEPLCGVGENTTSSQHDAKIIDELDFKSLGCVLEVMPCPFYGTKNIYTLKGNYDSEKGTMDGFDTDYVIEQEKFQWVRIIKIDVGGFAGGETKSQIFHGIIKNKSELKRTLQQLGCVPS